MLISQRLAGGKSLEATVKDFVANRPSFCPDNKRLDEHALSDQSSAYSGARKRLQLSAAKHVFDRVVDAITHPKVEFGFRPRQTFLLDGTTITLAPTDELRRVFPPATNQHGETVWPVMLMFVAHDLETGCACAPEVGRMYGGKGDSEALLCGRIVEQLPRGSIVMADAGLGIFRVAYESIESRHDILFRLTAGRFKTTLNVRIHEVEMGDREFLYLVTTLNEDAQSCADRYACRYDVETDIKCVKVAMDTENITAKSEAMVMKELDTSLAAYNLVIQFRRQAADVSGVPPRRLSFQGVCDTYESFLSTFLATEDIEACVDLRVRLRLTLKHRAENKCRLLPPLPALRERSTHQRRERVQSAKIGPLPGLGARPLPEERWVLTNIYFPHDAKRSATRIDRD